MSVLPSIITPTLLSTVRSYLHLPHHTWYFIAATALSVLNRPDEITAVYKHVIDHGPGATDCKPAHEEQLKISRRMREALVKAGAIGGLPKAI
jgi:hypothetical protein